MEFEQHRKNSDMKRFQVALYERYKKDFLRALKKNYFTYALFPKDDAVSMSVIQGWQYEKYLFDFLEINQIDTEGKEIIDIGANNGVFALDFASLVGETGKVHCFEPQRIIYYQLCTNVFLNGLTNVHCHHLALGDKSEDTVIPVPNYFDDGRMNLGDVSLLDNTSSKYEPVKMSTLDKFSFDNVAIIKIDVQGFEKNVLIGGVNTIMKHRPFLFIEFEEHLLKRANTSEEDLKKYIEMMDYSVFRFQEGIPYNTVSGKCLDCVCIPNEHNRQYIIP